MDSSLQFYTIPASYPFGKTFAKGLLARAQSLEEMVVLLPTRRACRVMREHFFHLSDGAPLLLPRLQPLGDVDEEELVLHLAGSEAFDSFLTIPPALSSVRRQILLAKLILKRPDFHGGFHQALKLSDALGAFIDQIYIEELEFEALQTLVPDEFADHWQITLEFLKILGEHWPEILKEQGVIDAADRRGRVMHALAEFWRDTRPEISIIAAGSTGSVPATARLMEVIAGLPSGEVILPGYDAELDEESWEVLEASHPQYGFKQLFGRINVARESVQHWSDLKNAEPLERDFLAREMMRPAAFVEKWTDLGNDAQTKHALERACRDFSLITCDTQRHEADIIALIFREALEDPGAKAALVTPDRVLAKRVAASCQRWGIDVDDSAGQPLDKTMLGAFFILVFEAGLKNLEPVSLLALLKNPFCDLAAESSIHALEKYLLRGLKPKPGFEGLRARLEAEAEHIPEASKRRIEDLIANLEAALGGLLELCRSEDPQGFEAFLQAHLEAAQALCSDGRLWQDEAGEKAAQFFNELISESRFLADIYGFSYLESLKIFMAGVSVRPTYGTHPRVKILGQLEARMTDADIVILGGLNEGSWPSESGHDPWMSRPMRAEFGLPDKGRSTGLSAHDFVQHFCSGGKVFLTRSQRIDGTEMIPARWLQRLETVMAAAGLPVPLIEDHDYKEILKSLDMSEETLPFTRPEPRPPVPARPVRLPVTKIETWLQDPYQIYARYVLNLKKLDPINQSFDSLQTGLALHDILERFISAHPDKMPDDAEAVLMNSGQAVMQGHDSDASEWSYWWPRFERIARWFCAHEKYWRENARPLALEVRGEMDLSASLNQGHFTLHGIADRVDRFNDGSAGVIDYKSGGSFSMSGIVSGKTPQLALEALILQHGGFADLGQYRASHLSYLVMSGGSKPGTHVSIEDEQVAEALEKAHAGLITLVETFQDPEIPYYAQPRSDRMARFNDYAHLARVQEWAAQGDSDEAS